MSDKDDRNDDFDVSEGDAKRLLNDGDDAGNEDGGEDRKRDSDTDERDWKTEAAKWKSLARKHEKTATERGTKLSEYEAATKSDAQRLEEDRDSHRSRADRAEAALKRREIAEKLAPEHATVKQIAQVAKRLTGDDDDALEEDARELFALVVPVRKTDEDDEKPRSKTAGRPTPRLKGGTADPNEDPDESDPRKLAALLPRRS